MEFLDLNRNNRLTRLVNEAFGDEKPDAHQMKAIETFAQYIHRNGIIPELPGEDRLSTFIKILENILKENYSTNLHKLTDRTRKRDAVMLRSFCWLTIKTAFPFISDDKINRVAGGNRRSSAVSYGLRKIRADILYDIDTARRYRVFKGQLEERLEKISRGGRP